MCLYECLREGGILIGNPLSQSFKAAMINLLFSLGGDISEGQQLVGIYVDPSYR